MMKIGETGMLITLSQSVAIVSDGDFYVGRYFVVRLIQTINDGACQYEVSKILHPEKHSRGNADLHSIESATRPIVNWRDSLIVSNQEFVR